jgi:CCR4-NOT transcription complex subunit 6
MDVLPSTRIASKRTKILLWKLYVLISCRYILLDKRTIEYANIAINRPDMKSEHDVFNRVMPRDNIAIVLLLENRQTGARLIVANTHCHWDAAYKDVKVVQVAILLEQLAKIAEEYTRHPPCKIADKRMFRFSSDADPVVDEDGIPIEPDVKPELPEPQPSQEYTQATQIPLLICIDTNSTPDSGVYELLSTGALPPNHPDFGTFSYGSMTRTGMSHPFTLKSAYSPKDLPFTNYTPGFEGMIDYIWYTAPHMNVQGLLGRVDEQYLSRCPGFPSWHFPSDHLALLAELGVAGTKRRGKVVETDFGPSGGTGGSGSRRRGD